MRAVREFASLRSADAGHLDNVTNDSRRPSDEPASNKLKICLIKAARALPRSNFIVSRCSLVPVAIIRTSSDDAAHPVGAGPERAIDSVKIYF